MRHDAPQTSETFFAALTPLTEFYVWLQEAQLTYARRTLDTYATWLKSLGVPAGFVDYHSYVMSSAIEAPDAQARAWAMRFTSGGFAPAK